MGIYICLVLTKNCRTESPAPSTVWDVLSGNLSNEEIINITLVPSLRIRSETSRRIVEEDGGIREEQPISFHRVSTESLISVMPVDSPFLSHVSGTPQLGVT